MSTDRFVEGKNFAFLSVFLKHSHIKYVQTHITMFVVLTNNKKIRHKTQLITPLASTESQKMRKHFEYSYSF